MRRIVPKDAILIPENATKVFEGIIFDVYQWQQTMFDGTTQTFEMLRRPDTIQVIGVLDDGKLIVTDEQQPFGKTKLNWYGFPGGRADKFDADYIAAAKREMLEETGYEFEQYKIVHVLQPHTKIEWFIVIVIATNPSKKDAMPELAGERIRVEELPFEKVRNSVLSGQGDLKYYREIFIDAHTLEALVGLPEFEGTVIESEMK